MQRIGFEDGYELALFAAEYFILGAAFPSTQHLPNPAVTQKFSQLCEQVKKRATECASTQNKSVKLDTGIRKKLCNCKNPPT